MSPAASSIQVRPTLPRDFAAVERLSRLIYPNDAPWTLDELASTLTVFPEGQLVAVEAATGRVVGMAASLILSDYFLCDPKSKGCAALIEWINDRVATSQDYTGRDPRFQPRGVEP